MRTARIFSFARRWAMRGALILTLLVLTALLAPNATPSPSAFAAPAIPVESLLNADGTLNTTTGVSGAVDLRGWNVTMDAVRGPVLAPAGQTPNAPTALGWSALGTGVDGSVNALAVSGADLYVGGGFTTCGGVSGCNYVAKWNGTTGWSTLGTGVNASVRALAVSGADLYVGGFFNTCGGASGCYYVAKWNGSSWSALGTGLDYGVEALAVSGADLYVGGRFTTCGGASGCNYVAKWNGSAWSTLGTGVDSYVQALAVSGADLYVGGLFSTCGGVSGCYRVAKWNGSSWSTLGAGVNSAVSALAVSGADLYVGGGFTTCGGASGCDRVAKWNGSSWSTLGTGVDFNVLALAVSGADLYVGGRFTTCGGASGCNNVAKWNGSSWATLGTGVDDGVFALAMSSADLYVGGAFITCDGASGCNRVAKYWDVTCTSQASGNWNTVATWDCGSAPGAGDNVVISNTHTVTLDTDTANLDNVTLDSGGTLTNNGAAHTVSLTGNWSNSGTFTPGTYVSVTFDGTGAQTLTGSIAFYNLTVNNTGGSVTLVNDMTVDNALTLTSGLLTLGAHNLTLGAAATIGGAPSETAMVVATDSGELRKTITGAGSFTFPVGDNTGTAEYSPVTLNFTSGAFSSAYAAVRLTDAKHPNNTSATNFVTRYWTVTSSGISSFSCNASFFYLDADIAGTEASLYAGKYNGSTWTLLDAVDAPNNKLSGTVTSFSDFTGGESGPLAAALASFDAAQAGDAIRVTWETVSEIGNVGFNLWRGTSPSAPDAQLNASLIPSQAPGSSQGFSYEWLDAANLVNNTTYYYWLEDMDMAGAVTRHGPISATYAAPTAVHLLDISAAPAFPIVLPLVAMGLAGLSALTLRRRR